MRGLSKSLRGTTVASVLCIVAFACAACSGKQAGIGKELAGEPADRPATDRAVGTPTTAAAEPTEPPAESGLSLKRGLVMLQKDRATFRPCNESVELWLTDQTDGVLRQTFGADSVGGETTLYIEAYGERAPVAPEDGEAARAFAGTFILEEVLYATGAGEGRGCAAPTPDYIVQARGNEPFWAVEVRESQVTWRQPDDPKELPLGEPQPEDSEGAVRYRASAGDHSLELLIESQSCRDSMSGDYFAYSAQATLDGRPFKGCARVGQ